MSDKLSPDTASRLLRAKAAELENLVHGYVSQPHVGGLPFPTDMALAADLALIASLLADHLDGRV